MAGEWTLSVTQLNEYVRKTLSGDPMLRAIRVSGELSGVKRQSSGHVYFTLKDDNARVQCVMFRSAAMGLSFALSEGMQVVVTGSASLYTASGSFQLYVEDVTRQGVGELYLRYEALKRRLAAEGLFDPSIKRELPPLPKVIGVVTSRTGAVLRDIVRVAWRRDPHVKIILAPCAVQGDLAAQEIASAIQLLNRQGEAQVILCGRGGGSLEDLWPFNEEIVARAIRASAIPVVSCVGHETDYTIADFAADLRAPTPSAAAEMTVPAWDGLNALLEDDLSRLHTALYGLLKMHRMRLDRLCASAALTRPDRLFIDQRRNALTGLLARLNAAPLRFTSGRRQRLEACAQSLDRLPPRLIGDRRRRLDGLISRLARQGEALTGAKRAELAGLMRALEAVNPGAVLGRGYAVVLSGGQAVTNAGALTEGQHVRIRFSQGKAIARVTDIEE